MPTNDYQDTLNHVNTYSNPSELRITDVRVANLVNAPMPCPLVKVYTNQGIVGFGEVRDGADARYALQLKSRILGENPCNIDKIFRRIKQFGHHARQGGGVCAIEVALWDLAGKAYGVPVYAMLGGKFRDDIRMYCDTDVRGKNTGTAMGQALKARMEKGFTFLKMDLGIYMLRDVPGALSAPLGSMDWPMPRMSREEMAALPTEERRDIQRKMYEYMNVAHPFTGIHVTEIGLQYMEQYVTDVRDVVGWEVPISTDHFGHIPVEDCIKIAQRLDKFNLAWYEDMVPWQMTEAYVRLQQSTTTPVCTGEDIYLKENFEPLVASGGVSVIHPDLLTVGGIYELKKVGDMAQGYGVSMAVHMAESPIACLAAAHAACATENFLALEFHSNDVPWWDDIVIGTDKPLIKNGWLTVPDKPGLGIDDLNDEVIREHLDPRQPGLWEPTDEWNEAYTNDRLWS